MVKYFRVCYSRPYIHCRLPSVFTYFWSCWVVFMCTCNIALTRVIVVTKSHILPLAICTVYPMRTMKRNVWRFVSLKKMRVHVEKNEIKNPSKVKLIYYNTALSLNASFKDKLSNSYQLNIFYLQSLCCRSRLTQCFYQALNLFALIF